MTTMPAQRPHRSKQNYGTPWEFIYAVEKPWGPIIFDLAASEGNQKVRGIWQNCYFSEAEDSLSQSWTGYGNFWLNPPYTDIGAWAKKAAFEHVIGRNKIFMLVPASIGSNWFAEHVHGKAAVLALSPRLTFEGCKDPYPKDCILAIYGETPSFDVWRWK